jgi:hypothetical protein
MSLESFLNRRCISPLEGADSQTTGSRWVQFGLPFIAIQASCTVRAAWRQ